MAGRSSRFGSVTNTPVRGKTFAARVAGEVVLGVGARIAARRRAACPEVQPTATRVSATSNERRRTLGRYRDGMRENGHCVPEAATSPQAPMPPAQADGGASIVL